MSFTVIARADDHFVTASVETAKEAFAKAVEWQVVERLTNISISERL